MEALALLVVLVVVLLGIWLGRNMGRRRAAARHRAEGRAPCPGRRCRSRGGEDTARRRGLGAATPLVGAQSQLVYRALQ